MAVLVETFKSMEYEKRGSHGYVLHTCVDCGKSWWVRLLKGNPLSKRCRKCASMQTGLLHRGPNSAQWRGGRHGDGRGYIRVLLGRDDFFYSMANKNSLVLEHRLIMAKYLGRCLHSWEIIHHLNGVKSDNRIENLQLVDNDRHKQITILQSKLNKLLEGQEELKIQNDELRKEIRLLRFENKDLKVGSNT